jgi:hypothetical protein
VLTCDIKLLWLSQFQIDKWIHVSVHAIVKTRV